MEVTVGAAPVMLPWLEPAATGIDATTVPLYEIGTTTPPAGAACDNVTVQVTLAPEETVDGVHCSPVTLVCAVTVTEAIADPPFSEAVIDTA